MWKFFQKEIATNYLRKTGGSNGLEKKFGKEHWLTNISIKAKICQITRLVCPEIKNQFHGSI